VHAVSFIRVLQFIGQRRLMITAHKNHQASFICLMDQPHSTAVLSNFIHLTDWLKRNYWFLTHNLSYACCSGRRTNSQANKTADGRTSSLSVWGWSRGHLGCCEVTRCTASLASVSEEAGRSTDCPDCVSHCEDVDVDHQLIARHQRDPAETRTSTQLLK